MVCDREVWRSLLRGIEKFTTERVEELGVFGSDIGGLEVMAEVFLAAARTLQDDWGCNVQRWGRLRRRLVPVSAEGWGGQGTVKVTVHSPAMCIKRLVQVAHAVGAKYKIVDQASTA